jgi:hypothetical protein
MSDSNTQWRRVKRVQLTPTAPELPSVASGPFAADRSRAAAKGPSERTRMTFQRTPFGHSAHRARPTLRSADSRPMPTRYPAESHAFDTEFNAITSIQWNEERSDFCRSRTEPSGKEHHRRHQAFIEQIGLGTPESRGAARLRYSDRHRSASEVSNSAAPSGLLPATAARSLPAQHSNPLCFRPQFGGHVSL